MWIIVQVKSGAQPPVPQQPGWAPATSLPAFVEAASEGSS
jgi:hypothetical protein